MRLQNVYDQNGRVLASTFRTLFNLLKERRPYQNISHRKMPKFIEHCSFVLSRPYAHWYLIQEVENTLGSIYLTHQDELGISLFSVYKGMGHGSQALDLFMLAHPRDRYLANINPKNLASIEFFEKQGFEHLQETYELRRKKCAPIKKANVTNGCDSMNTQS